jgi:hypothetical protein
MLLVYSYCLGARRQQWMPFWPPFATVGEQFVENTGKINIGEGTRNTCLFN